MWSSFFGCCLAIVCCFWLPIAGVSRVLYMMDSCTKKEQESAKEDAGEIVQTPQEVASSLMELASRIKDPFTRNKAIDVILAVEQNEESRVQYGRIKQRLLDVLKEQKEGK